MTTDRFAYPLQDSAGSDNFAGLAVHQTMPGKVLHEHWGLRHPFEGKIEVEPGQVGLCSHIALVNNLDSAQCLAVEPDMTEAAGVSADDIEEMIEEVPGQAGWQPPGEQPDRAAEIAVPDIEASGFAAFDIAAPAGPVGLLAAVAVVRPEHIVSFVDFAGEDHWVEHIAVDPLADADSAYSDPDPNPPEWQRAGQLVYLTST